MLNLFKKGHMATRIITVVIIQIVRP